MARSTSNTDFKGMLGQLESTLDLYLGQKAPQLPENWRATIVRFAPWLAIIFFVITLPAVLLFFGISTFILPVSFVTGVGNGVNYVLAMIVLAASLVLEALAIPGLFNRQKKAWNLLYYSALLNGVYNLFTLSLGSLIIGTGLTLYILFQIKKYYK